MRFHIGDMVEITSSDCAILSIVLGQPPGEPVKMDSLGLIGHIRGVCASEEKVHFYVVDIRETKYHAVAQEHELVLVKDDEAVNKTNKELWDELEKL